MGGMKVFVESEDLIKNLVELDELRKNTFYQILEFEKYVNDIEQYHIFKLVRELDTLVSTIHSRWIEEDQV